MLADVLHCFAKHAIVHELKKVLFKPILPLSAHLRVQINVLFQPWLLLELEDSIWILESFIPKSRYNFKFR